MTLAVKELPVTASFPKAVIFDWDNTLVDTWPVIHEALNETLQVYGKPLWTLEETKQRVHKSMRDSFPALFGEQWQEAGEHYRARYRELHLTNLKPLSGAEEMLRHLADKGVRMCVISNKTGPILRIEADVLKWTGFFSCLIGSGDLNVDKPAPDGVYHVLKDSGIAPEQAWFVGDSMVDVECARASGCRVVFYGDRFEYEEGRVELVGQDAHVMDHAALIGLLKGV